MLGRLARLALVVCLLAGWQSALVHPITHVDELGQFVHPANDHSGGSQACDALAALTACAAAARAVLPVAFAVHGAPALRHTGALLAAAAPPFRSQAPPPLL
jgi:hypothetical protein